jgi:T5orf172 domain
MAKWLYVFKDPLGSSDVKIGITSNPKVRLGAYQCAYSARSHKACFDFVWQGPPRQIDKLEGALKEKYKWDISSDKMGESEWITDIDLDTIIEVVNTEIKGWRFHIKPLEATFPITTDDIEWKKNG